MSGQVRTPVGTGEDAVAVAVVETDCRVSLAGIANRMRGTCGFALPDQYWPTALATGRLTLTCHSDAERLPGPALPVSRQRPRIRLPQGLVRASGLRPGVPVLIVASHEAAELDIIEIKPDQLLAQPAAQGGEAEWEGACVL